MHYQLEVQDNRFSLYSPTIGAYVLRDVSKQELQIAIATEIEYKAKLEIVKMLMTFTH